MFTPFLSRSRIHERTISLRFLGLILRVLRLEVSINNVTLQTSFKPLCSRGEGGVKSLVEVTVNKMEENLKTFVPITSKNLASVPPDPPLAISFPGMSLKYVAYKNCIFPTSCVQFFPTPCFCRAVHLFRSTHSVPYVLSVARCNQ